jgi:TPR repeat protein
MTHNDRKNMMTWFLHPPIRALVLAALVMSRPASADSYDDAVAAHRKGDDQAAVALLHPLADSGDVRAQALLGYFYDHGWGVPVDHARAVEYYLKAANQDDSGAAVNLCANYVAGEGVARDVAEGMRWCLAAARANNEAAHFNLANAYAVGEYGLPQDDIKAYMHYKLALMHASDPLMKQFSQESIDFQLQRMTSEEVRRADQMVAAWPAEIP